MRLIDADYLLRCIQSIEIVGAGLRNRSYTNVFRRLFSETVNEMPTVKENIQIVRCENCKYSSEIQPFTCLCKASNIRMPLDGFCSEGSRKK